MNRNLFWRAVYWIFLGLWLISLSLAANIDETVSLLHEKWFTIFGTVNDFQPNNYMRRDEAAKFFVKVAEWLGKINYIKSESECNFSDLSDGHIELKEAMIKSCRLGIFQGNEDKFMPTRALTNSQALAVMIRIISGHESEIEVSHWTDNYYKKAQTLWRLSQLPELNIKEWLSTRGTIAQLVYIFLQNSNNDLNTINTAVDCGSRIALGSWNDSAESCMNKQFKMCSPATMINFSLDPNQNPFESWQKTYYKWIFEIVWYKNSSCLVKLTSITSQISEWNNKSMICNFDASKTFIENINSYYLKKCSGELYDAML